MSNIKEIEQLRKKGQERTGEFMQKYRKQHQGNPQPFRDSTWLYIRSFDADDGARSPGIIHPEGGIFWLSPDIELYDSSGTSVDHLNEGEEYRIEIAIRNSGDLHAYSCTVEVYLCDPALGFALTAPSTVFLGMQHAEVMSGGVTTVVFPFVALPSHVGHKCMFARVHSVVNREIPAIVSTLDPFHNRHDAQQNLVIASSGEMIAFSMAMPEAQNNNMNMFIQAANKLPKTLLANKQLQSFKFLPTKVAATFEPQFLVLPIMGKEGPVFAPNAPIKKITSAIAKQYNLNLKDLPSKYMLTRGQLSWNFLMLGKGAQSSYLVVPDMGLKSGQAAAFQMFSVDQKQTVTGGITLIVRN